MTAATTVTATGAGATSWGPFLDKPGAVSRRAFFRLRSTARAAYAACIPVLSSASRRGGDRGEETADASPGRGAARRSAALCRPALPVEAHPGGDAAAGGKRGRRDDPHRRAEDERIDGPADPDREPARRGRVDRRRAGEAGRPR